MRIYLVILILLGFASCEKKDKPITLPPKGDGTVLQTDMGENYQYQYFINLQQQKIVHISTIDAWDIAFQTGGNEYHIFLNGGKGMAVYNTNKTNFSEVSYNDTVHARNAWIYDSPNGHIDSTAIGDWRNTKPIYIIKLNEAGTKLRKLQILSEDMFQYTIAIGDIGSAVPTTKVILKNAKQNYTYFAFDKLAVVDEIEPDKSTWDLQITRYNCTFYDQNPPLRYIVNGFLLNPTNTTAYKDSLTDYNTIDAAFANSVSLSSEKDAIGFNWKTYDIDKGIYSIVKKYNYIIQNQNGYYFKLRFLDFYSSTGIKGSPKFEFNQLQ